MSYEIVGVAVKNTDLQASQHEFSPRRKVFVVPDEYIRHELGWNGLSSLTPTIAEQLEAELRIRQAIPDHAIIKGIAVDFQIESVRIYCVSPNFPLVQSGIAAPEQLIDL